MFIFGILLMVVFLVNCILFNFIIEDGLDSRYLKILLFIPPFSIIGFFIVIVFGIFEYVLETVKKVLS